MSKSIKLRAFRIESKTLNQANTNIIEICIKSLEHSLAKDRRLRLNPDDENQEEDLISDYNLREVLVSGSMLRIAPSKDVLNIPDSLFNSEKIVIKELDKLQLNSDIIYKNHYYFSFNNKYLVTNLPLTTTITRFQTYINWLLRNFRGQTLYEITPIVVVQPNLRMQDIKKIRVNDTSINPYTNEDYEENNIFSRIKKIPLDVIESLFNDISSLHDALAEDMISAELLIKFKKSKKFNSADYQRVMGAYLKPISDVENVTIYPKNGQPISGKDLHKIKTVIVETVESGKISEEQLYQQMENFINEISDE
ncbi:hypothetical protein [Chryseobacterium camelliae]|uniref:hypothetical protein n=1 Tax=Chryseobacterium camelliae TaxID=1265445 RepID=UPI000C1C9372|nr:hypothetical protein [Chryseobacterium camelliae]